MIYRENKYKIVCEAGIIWRLLFHRLESRVNDLTAQGWLVEKIDCWGLFRRSYVVTLRLPPKE